MKKATTQRYTYSYLHINDDTAPLAVNLSPPHLFVHVVRSEPGAFLSGNLRRSKSLWHTKMSYIQLFIYLVISNQHNKALMHSAM